MKSVLAGLVIALCICGLLYFLYLPEVKSKSYQEGYDKGVTVGTANGLAQGMETAKAEQKKQADSVAVLVQLQRDSVKRIPKPVQKKEKVNYDINFRVIGNKIEERVEPQPAAPDNKDL